MSFQAKSFQANNTFDKPKSGKYNNNNNNKRNPHKKHEDNHAENNGKYNQNKTFIQKNKQQHNQQQHNIKYIDVTDGDSGFINITIETYVEGINSFELTVDALELCNRLGVRNQNHWNIAVQSAAKFLNALRGVVSMNNKEQDLLNYYKIGLVPVYSKNIRKNIAYIKWMLSASAKANNFDDEFATYVGMLAGICLYFNEIDVMNASNRNNTQHYRDLCQKYTSTEF